MAVKFLSNVNLEGNDVVNVNSIEASSATFARSVTFNDTIQSGEEEWYIESGGFAEFKESIRTPMGEIGILDMQNLQYGDSPSGMIVFDMNGYTYDEDNLIAGIVYDGTDIKIKSSRDIILQAFASVDNLTVDKIFTLGSVQLSNMTQDNVLLVNGDIKVGQIVSNAADAWEIGTRGAAKFASILLYNIQTEESDTISIDGNGNVSCLNFAADNITTDQLSGLSSIIFNDVGAIGGEALNIGVDSAVSINGALNVTRGIYLVSNETEKVKIDTDGIVANVPIFLSTGYSWAGERYGIYSGGGSATAIFVGQAFVDSILINGEAATTKAYVDEMFNKLMTNPDETINSITELLALLEGNKESLGNRYNDTFEGDGTTKTFTVTHDFNTWNVVVAVYDNATRKQVFADVTLISTDAVTIGFDTAPAEGSSYEVIVLS